MKPASSSFVLSSTKAPKMAGLRSVTAEDRFESPDKIPRDQLAQDQAPGAARTGWAVARRFALAQRFDLTAPPEIEEHPLPDQRQSSPELKAPRPLS